MIPKVRLAPALIAERLRAHALAFMSALALATNVEAIAEVDARGRAPCRDSARRLWFSFGESAGVRPDCCYVPAEIKSSSRIDAARSATERKRATTVRVASAPGRLRLS